MWKPAQARFLTVSGIGATLPSFLLAQTHNAEEQETEIHSILETTNFTSEEPTAVH